MATRRETTAFILEQMEGVGDTSVKSMFGEFAIYLDGKVLGFICDDTLFLKDTAGARALIAQPETGEAYPGSKPYLIGSALLDDPETLKSVVRAVWDDLPMPKPKKPRRTKG